MVTKQEAHLQKVTKTYHGRDHDHGLVMTQSMEDETSRKRHDGRDEDHGQSVMANQNCNVHCGQAVKCTVENEQMEDLRFAPDHGCDAHHSRAVKLSNVQLENCNSCHSCDDLRKVRTIHFNDVTTFTMSQSIP